MMHVCGLTILFSKCPGTTSCPSDLILPRTLIEEVIELQKLSAKATWKQILENEQDATSVKDIIQRIDESLKTFQVSTDSLN